MIVKEYLVSYGDKMNLREGLLRVGNYLARIGDRPENENNEKGYMLALVNEEQKGMNGDIITKSETDSYSIFGNTTKFVRAAWLKHDNKKYDSCITFSSSNRTDVYIYYLVEANKNYKLPNGFPSHFIKRISEKKYIVTTYNDFTTGLPSDKNGEKSNILLSMLTEGKTAEEARKVASAMVRYIDLLSYLSTASVTARSYDSKPIFYNGIGLRRLDDILYNIMEHEEYDLIDMEIGETLTGVANIPNKYPGIDFGTVTNYEVGPDGKPVHKKDEWKHTIIPDWQEGIKIVWGSQSVSDIKKGIEELGKIGETDTYILGSIYLERPIYEKQNS